ncbi:hypothetical protein [Lysobacter gummosus]
MQGLPPGHGHALRPADVHDLNSEDKRISQPPDQDDPEDVGNAL